MNFTLHPMLEKDTFPVTELPLCRVVLMNNALFPWLILIPKQNDLKEITDLSAPDRLKLMQEISDVSEAMQDMFDPDKLNVAALGNQCPQLHIHIIGRYKEDQAWPEPVWGKGCVPYDDRIKAMMMERLESVKKLSS